MTLMLLEIWVVLLDHGSLIKPLPLFKDGDLIALVKVYDPYSRSGHDSGY